MVFVLQCAVGLSQNERSKWCMGVSGGIDFMTSPPTAFLSQITASAGCASIADAAGNLLFYTNGRQVWTAAGTIMANGSSLAGELIATQSALIVQKPGSTNLYYIFTLKASTNVPSFFYSVVDMSLAGGQGSVTVLNAPLYAGPLAEKLTAVRHCNGSEYWIITHEAYSNTFRANLLTSAGVSTTAVLSQVGTNFTGTASGDYVGYMKASPNGRKLGVAMRSIYNKLELLDFDPATGIVSNPLVLSSGVPPPWYGCEFSPDNSKFYACGWGLNKLFQWDLCAGSNAAIVASKLAIATPSAFTTAMQLAPDGKIYMCIASSTASSMSVIDNPNAAGVACNFIPAAFASPLWVQVPGGSGPLLGPGLPNFVTDFSLTHPPLAPFTYTVSPAYGCQTASFNAMYLPSLSTTVGCTPAGYAPLGMMWDFGDPASGTANTSTLSNPYHQFSTTGSYTTQLVIYYTCGIKNDTVRQVVQITQPCITVNSASISCATLGSATAALTGVGPYSFTWTPTGQTSPVATGLSPGSYTITVYDAGVNATSTTAVTFTPQVPFTGNLSNSPNLVCNGASTGTAAILNLAGGSGAEHYLWSNGAITYTVPNPSTLGAGLWNVTVTDALTACTINQAFFISQPPAVVVTAVASASSACVNTTLVLTGSASGGSPGSGAGYTYNWTAGPAGTTHTVSESTGGSYNYTLTAVDGSNCAGSAVVTVTFNSYPLVIVNNASICPLQTGTLTAGGASTYTWNGGATGGTFTDAPLADAVYSVTGESLGCSTTATAAILLKPVPLPAFTGNSPVCQGSALMVSASGGASYQWTGPNTFTSASATNTINTVPLTAGGVYNVTVTAANACTAAVSGTVTVQPAPAVNISPVSSSICINAGSITLSASGTAASYSWQPAQILPNSQTISVSPSASQVYTLSGSLNGCTSGATAIVHVLPSPLPVISLSSPSLCAQLLNGSPHTITLTAGGAAVYTISVPNHIFNSNPAGPSSTFSMQPPYDTGVATATVYGGNGACTLSATAVFTIVPNPTVSIANPTPVICAGQSYTYTSAGAASYTWSSSTPGQTAYTTGDVAVASPSIQAIFSVFGGSLGCNSALQSTTLTVNPLPEVAVLPNPAVTCLHHPLTLTTTGTGTSFEWLPGAWPGNSSLTVDPAAQQTYTVIAGLNSCTAAAAITVSVLPLPEIRIISPQEVMCLGHAFVLEGSGGSNYSWTFPNYFTAQGHTVQVTPADASYSGIYTLTASGPNGCTNLSTASVHIEDRPGGYLKSSELSGCAPLQGNYQFIATNFPSQELTVSGWQINNSIQLPAGDRFSYRFTKPGSYFVNGTVTTQHGCSNVLTVTISVYPQPAADFSFTPSKPVESLDPVTFIPLQDQGPNDLYWYFINNDHSNQSRHLSPERLFDAAGVYPVALVVKNQWGCTDSVVKTIVVDPDLSVYVPNAFTPNDDGHNELFLPVVRGVKSIKFMVCNRWNELLYATGSLSEAGWDGSYNGQPCKEDVYVWKLEVTGLDNRVKKLSGLFTLYR